MAVFSRLYIIGLGAATPIGRTVWASAAAARAGLCGFAEHPFMIDTAGEPMRVARAPWLEVGVGGAGRFRELLLPVIDEALAPVQGYVEQHAIKIGLALGLPPCRPGQPEVLADDLRDVIVQQYPGFFSQISAFEVGHAAGHLCLDAALKECQAERVDAYIVSGVDSYMAPETLEWVEECDQLHGGGPLNNAWGFIPGEAASAVTVATGKLAKRLGVGALGNVVSVGLGRETKLIKTDDVCIGEGLTQAFRQALGDLAPNEQIHNVFCDLNGEKYRADEYGFTALRNKDRFRSASDFVAPADCWGDVGAAGAFLHMALAVICHRKRYGKGPLSMVCASSESGERGAAIIRALDQKVI
jgi:3-oxoacyl-[acyl-carrier-protein] synthase-1